MLVLYHLSTEEGQGRITVAPPTTYPNDRKPGPEFPFVRTPAHFSPTRHISSSLHLRLQILWNLEIIYILANKSSLEWQPHGGT